MSLNINLSWDGFFFLILLISGVIKLFRLIYSFKYNNNIIRKIIYPIRVIDRGNLYNRRGR